MHAFLQSPRIKSRVNFIADRPFLTEFVEIGVVGDSHMEGRTFEYFVLGDCRFGDVEVGSQLIHFFLLLLADGKERILATDVRQISFLLCFRVAKEISLFKAVGGCHLLATCL